MAVLDYETFRRRFAELVVDCDMTWEAVGFLTPKDTVYTFGTDTKVISTVFEALSAPLVQAIADELGYHVEGAPQTVYPDFTLSLPTGAPARIAVDIKTTYRSFDRRGRLRPFRYTLGSYTSFLRSPGAAKNIRYPYKEYSHHWVIGFLYTRVEGVPAKVYHRDDAAALKCPYKDVECFVQEKHKIVGLRPGSGNTTNIGSFPTADIRDLLDGRGPFATSGKDFCDDYWRNYGPTASTRKYTNIREFLMWRKQFRQGKGDSSSEPYPSLP